MRSDPTGAALLALPARESVVAGLEPPVQPTVQPLMQRLPQVDPATQRAALAWAGRQLSGVTAGVSWSLVTKAVPRLHSGSDNSPMDRVIVTKGLLRLELWLPLGGLIAERFGMSLSCFSAPVRSLLVDQWCRGDADSSLVGPQCLSGWQVESVEPAGADTRSRSATDEGLSLQIRLADGVAVDALVVAADADTRAAVLQAVQGWPRVAPSIASRSIPLAVRWQITTLPLSLAELHGINPGDLLLTDCAVDTPHELRGRLLVGARGTEHVSRQVVARLALDGLRITNMDTVEAITQDLELTSVVGPDLLDLAVLQVDISVDLGEWRLSLDELARLQPGCVLSHARSFSDMKVRVLANQQPVAAGELVAVGDRLGVRVLHLASHEH